MAYEILDIVLGFTKGVNRERYIGFQRALGREPLPDPKWVKELRLQLVNELPRFRALTGHPNAGIAESAGLILDELSAKV